MKSISKNMFVTILTRIVTLITGLIVQQRILVAYGSSLNGLTSSISQVMSYLVLLEAGLGTASIQALYNPLSRNDWNTVSGIVTATGREYKKISIAFFTLLIFASLLLPLAVNGQVDLVIAGLLTLITGGSYVVSYILGGKYKALLTADRRLYILNLCEIISIVISCVLRVLALLAGYNIVIVQTINLACVFIKNAGYVIYVKRKYKEINYSHEPDFSSIKKRWNVLVHSLAGIVVNHTDIMILTIFADLKIVSVYGVYNLVFSQLSATVQSTFMTAPQANFGQLYNKDRMKFEKAYGIYETGLTLVLFVITTIALIMILPFVSLYTKDVNDIKYIDSYLPILFAVILLMNQIRIPAIMTINVIGDYKETQFGAVIEAIINIVVSAFLFFFTPLGLYGLLIGTVCSYIYRTTDVITYIYKHVLERSIFKFIKSAVTNVIVMISLYFLFVVLLPVTTFSFVEWIFKAVLVSVICIIVYFAINYLFNREEISAGISFAFSRFLKKSKP